MVICVSLELWRCICMEMMDSNKKLLKIWIYSSKNWWDRSCKLSRCCMEDFAIVDDIVQADTFLCDIDNVHGSMVRELARRRIGKTSITLQLSRYNSHIWHAKSTLSSKPIVVHRVINSSKHFSTWSGVWLLVNEELNIFSQGMCINCEEHNLTN